MTYLGIDRRAYLLLLIICLTVGQFIKCDEFETEKSIKLIGRSKIHITIDVDTSKSKTGKFLDISKGKIKDISIKEVNSKEDKSRTSNEETEDENDRKYISNFKKQRNTPKPVRVQPKSKQTKLKSMLKKPARENKVRAKKMKKKGSKFKTRQNKSIKISHKKENRRNSKLGSLDRIKMKKLKKKRKEMDFIPNSAGGPNPKDLKIPLTFSRKEIQTISKQKEPALKNRNNTQFSHINNTQLSNRNSEYDLNEMKSLAKQVVVATLKQMNTLGANNTNIKPSVNLSNPLEIRMRKQRDADGFWKENGE